MITAPKRVVVLGFSQGSATAARWVMRGRVRPTDLVLWGGFVPPEASPAPELFKRATLTFVHGAQESYATSVKVAEEMQRLKSAGLESRDVEFEGGHEVNAAGLQALVTALT
jgi:predicted esterase